MHEINIRNHNLNTSIIEYRLEHYGLIYKYYLLMKKFISQFLLLLLIQTLILLCVDKLLIVQSFAAGGSCLEDGSCVSKASCIVADDINTNIKNYIPQLAEYSMFIDAFSMNSTDAEGEKPAKGATGYSDGTPIIYDSSGNPLPLCSVPTKNIKFCYNPIGGSNQCKTMQANDYQYMQGAFFQAIDTGAKICVQVLGSLGWTTMGCKYSAPPARPASDYDKCYVSPSCAERTSQHSKGFFPLSAIIVECVKESVEKVMLSDQLCYDDTGKPKVNVLPNMQNALRQTVKIALVLYVILFGIRTALGPSMPDKSEWFIFFLKMILVLYFSVGIYVGNNQSNRVPNSSFNVNAAYEDGLTKFIVPYSMAIANSLANIAFQAGGNKNLCKYTPCSLCKNCSGCVNYAPGYEYLALWDSLDCRIAFYLMIVGPKDAGGKIEGSGINGSVPLRVFKYNIFSTIVAAFFSMQILFIILSICFAVLFISICLFFIHTYVIALIAIGIMIYIAPIFVPMALFKPTKPYFDGWSRMLLSFVMQPMVISGFLALVLTVFDQAFYTDCVWNSPTTVNIPVVGDVPFYELSVNQSPLCYKSFGYSLARMLSVDSVINQTTAIFFDVSLLSFMPENIMSGLLIIVIFSVLFYFFAESVAAIAADITGGPSLGGMAIGPTAFANKVMDLVQKGIDVALAAFTVATAGAGAAVGVAAQAAQQAAQEAAKQVVRASITAVKENVKTSVKEAAQEGAQSTTNRGGPSNQPSQPGGSGVAARGLGNVAGGSSGSGSDSSSSSSSSSSGSGGGTVTRKTNIPSANDEDSVVGPDNGGEL